VRPQPVAQRQERPIRATARLGPGYQEETAVSFIDKAKNKLQQVQGQVKQKTGERTGDKNLQAEGKTDTAKGNLKNAGENLKDGLS